MSEDRLEYLKETLDKQKNRPAVVLRRADAEWAVNEVERLRYQESYSIERYRLAAERCASLDTDNQRLASRMKMYEKQAVHLAAENDLLKVSLKQANSKRAAEIINDHFKGGEW
jgi:hypothetical protein